MKIANRKPQFRDQSSALPYTYINSMTHRPKVVYRLRFRFLQCVPSVGAAREESRRPFQSRLAGAPREHHLTETSIARFRSKRGVEGEGWRRFAAAGGSPSASAAETRARRQDWAAGSGRST